MAFVSFHHLSYFIIGTSSSFFTLQMYPISKRLSHLSRVTWLLKDQGMDLGLLVFIYIYVVVCPLNLLGSIHIHMQTHKNSNIGIFWGEDLLGRRTDVERNVSRNLLKSDSCEYSTQFLKRTCTNTPKGTFLKCIGEKRSIMHKNMSI